MIEIVKLTEAERDYWNQHNPLKGYRKTSQLDIDKAIQGAINHVWMLIEPRLELGHKYFHFQSDYPDLLQFRKQIKDYFQSQGADIVIRRGGYIFVKDVWGNFTN